ELRVAQGGEGADSRGDDERQHQRGAGSQTGGVAGRGGADGGEDAGADDGADAEERHLESAQLAPQRHRALGGRQDVVQVLDLEDASEQRGPPAVTKEPALAPRLALRWTARRVC